MSPISTSIPARSTFAITLLAVFLCLWGQFNKDVWTPDEPRVVAIADEMAITGDIIIPHLAGQPFVEKPPLYFALAAGAIKLMPMLSSISAVRTFNILLALLTLYFTYLLGRDLLDKTSGMLAVIVLGSMLGFVVNSHWCRVDNLLIVTLLASVWSLYRGITKHQLRYLLWAGVWAGLSFLTKGLIGVIMLGGCWLGLMTARYLRLRYIQHNPETSDERFPTFNTLFMWHAMALLIFLLISGSWVTLFWLQGTTDTWNQWFWINNIGRFTGTTTGLGHLHPGQPLFYIKALAEYSLPWLPLILTWLGSLISRWRRSETIPLAELFILFSLLINMLVLSAADTKRSLYLFVLLPFWAIAITYAIRQLQQRWFLYYQRFWLGLCVLLITAIFTTPLYISHFANKIPQLVVNHLSHFGLMHIVLATFLLTLLVWYRTQEKNLLTALSISTIMLFVSLLGLLNRPIDLIKSMSAETTAFVEQIPVNKRAHIVGIDLNETTRSIFYLYSHWSVRNVTDLAFALAILQGQDKNTSSVIIDQNSLLAQLKLQLAKRSMQVKILAIGNPRSGKNRSSIYWLTAIPQYKVSANANR